MDKKTSKKKNLKIPSLKDQILAELNKILDPELGAGIVDLGLIYSVQIKNKAATIKMTLTSPGCPLMPWFVEQVQNTALQIPGIKKVKVEIVYDPPWTPEKMKPELREKIYGY